VAQQLLVTTRQSALSCGDGHTPAAGLYVKMLNALGVDTVTKFGDKMSDPLDLA
jgi:hypothetical protein